ncbi:MAG: polynucleotide adenylyltransferase PcnB [Pseudomonadota bacterium]|nr:polynucleotide adenylyltransferase PcnB [Pseudomonadota bacterium]
MSTSQREHGITRASISEQSLKVLQGLNGAGYEAYLVGGGVRDLLLGREPKDFDVVTDARPEQVRKLFRNSRLIGRRFRLAHVYFGRNIVEVATFRAAPGSDGGESLLREGRIIRDNAYGTIDEDALRRDFTINALYYNIRDNTVLDYAGGGEDLKHGLIRLIGDPDTRYREDPVRMLRAVRFAAKLGFRIDPESERPLRELGPLLEDIAPARLFDEVLKLFQGGFALDTFEVLRHYGLFERLFPDTEESLSREEEGFPITFVSRALQNTDKRIREGKPVTPAFLYAALLWEPVRHLARRFQEEGMGDLEALQTASREVVSRQIAHTSLPKRFSIPMREIWQLQPRFRTRTGKRPMRLLDHPRFRAAYDFMCLREAAGEDLEGSCEWWTQIQELDPETRAARIRQPRKRRRGRRPGGKVTDVPG